jgi:hypothetical protein
VPTPFYHLRIANRILNLATLNPQIKHLIEEHLGAFYLGNTAPDVQVISNQKRSATHFFQVPIPRNAQVPWERILSEYPGLKTNLDSPHAMFICGYLCHLQADWIWVSEIFEPVFGPRQTWASFSERLYWHNILRAYLDLQVLEELPIDKILEAGFVDSHNWLPFIRDRDLETWWVYLCDQLRPGKSVKTIEVFADRQGIDVLEFQAMLDSDESLQENIFKNISHEALDDYCEQLVTSNVSLLNDYLGPMIAPGSETHLTDTQTGH